MGDVTIVLPGSPYMRKRNRVVAILCQRRWTWCRRVGRGCIFMWQSYALPGCSSHLLM